jgi:hypothetical protein
MSGGSKTPLLIAAIFMSIAIGTVAAPGRNHQAAPQSLAYGGHSFDRTTNDFQSDRQPTTVAFMISSRTKLERRQQLQFRAAQAAFLGSRLSSGDNSCGRGRYRDSTSGKCRGPADISPHE